MNQRVERFRSAAFPQGYIPPSCMGYLRRASLEAVRKFAYILITNRTGARTRAGAACSSWGAGMVWPRKEARLRPAERWAGAAGAKERTLDARSRWDWNGSGALNAQEAPSESLSSHHVARRRVFARCGL